MAKFNFLNLDDDVRALMVQEINEDIREKRLYLSGRLNEVGKQRYPDFLIESVSKADEQYFERQFNLMDHFNPQDFSRGRYTKMPSNAATLLCQSEFNRYYIRAVCLKAIASNVKSVEIYRARDSSWVRPESEIMIGKLLDPQELLDDLRLTIGSEPNLLPYINSGLSIRF